MSSCWRRSSRLKLVLDADEARPCPSPPMRRPRRRAARPSKLEQPISRTLPAATSALQRPERLLDRHVVVGPVQLVEVDAVGAEPRAGDASQRLTARRRACAALVHRPPNLVAMTTSSRRRPERPAEELLALAAAVDVGRVEEA